MASTKISDQAGSSNIWLGSKQNSRQTILYIPADIAVGGGTKDKPGLLFLESISATGGVGELGGLYIWAESDDTIKYSATYPTDETGGTALGGGVGDVTAGAVITANTIVIGDDGAKGVKKAVVSIADSSGNMSSVGTLGCGAITTTGAFTFSGANPDIVGGDTNGVLSITAAATTSLGGIIKLYGDTHSSLAKDIEFYTDATKVLEYDASETIWDFNSKNIKGVGTLATGDITVDATLIFSTGSITDTGDTIDFDDEDLSTSGTLASGNLDVTGTIDASTTITAGTNIISTAGFISLADDQSVRLGALGETDSYIKWDATTDDLLFYDSNQSSALSLSELYAGTTLNPLVSGNLALPLGDFTITDGQFDWTNNTAGDVNTWTFANTDNDILDIVADTVNDGNIIDINADLINDGNFIHLDTNETNGAFKFLDCHDGGGATFTVALHGATVIGGSAAKIDALTLTAGDLSLTDGLIDCITEDVAAAGHNFLTKCTTTASIPYFKIISDQTDNDQALLNLTHVATGDIDVMEIVNAGSGYGISMALNNVASGGLEMVLVSDATGNGIYVEGVATNGYLGSSTTALLGVKQDGALATAASTAVRIDSDGTPYTAAMGYALLIDDDADAIATTYAMSINSANNTPLHLKAHGATKPALVVETQAQTVSSVIVDGATNNWQGAAGVGMLHLSCDDELGNVTASLLGVYQGTANPKDSARGFLARFIDTSPVASVPPAYLVEINSTNNFGLNIVTGVATATNLTLSGADAQSAAIINVVGTTTDGWDGDDGVGMVNLAGKGAHGHAAAALLNITDVTGAMISDARGSCLRIIDTATNASDAWIAYMKTTANDGLLIDTGHIDDINLKLSGTTAGVAQMFDVDGTTGSWVGANNVGMVEVNSNGILVAGANLLRIESSGGNVAQSHAVEIVTSGEFQGSTDGTSLRITDTGAAGGTSYAVYIDSSSNEAIHVDAGVVVVDEYVTAGVASSTAGGLVTAYHSANLTDTTPLDSEFDTGFGSTALAQAGFIGVAYDTSTTKAYLVVSDGTNWYFTAAMEQAGA